MLRMLIIFMRCGTTHKVTRLWIIFIWVGYLGCRYRGVAAMGRESSKLELLPCRHLPPYIIGNLWRTANVFFSQMPQLLHLQQSFLWALQSDRWHAEPQYATFKQPEHKRRCWRRRRPQFPHDALTRTKLSVTSPVGILFRGACMASPHISFCWRRGIPAARLIPHMISQHDTSSRGISKSIRWPLRSTIVTVRMAKLERTSTSLSLRSCCKCDEYISICGKWAQFYSHRYSRNFCSLALPMHDFSFRRSDGKVFSLGFCVWLFLFCMRGRISLWRNATDRFGQLAAPVCELGRPQTA